MIAGFRSSQWLIQKFWKKGEVVYLPNKLKQEYKFSKIMSLISKLTVAKNGKRWSIRYCKLPKRHAKLRIITRISLKIRMNKRCLYHPLSLLLFYIISQSFKTNSWKSLCTSSIYHATFVYHSNSGCH